MRKKGSNLRRPRGDYEIGKGRPPVASRWKPGQSGNPKGRPKKAKGIATMAREALERPLPVIVGGRKQQMSVRAVAYRKLGDKAANGDQKALGFLLMLANELQPPPELDGSETTVSSKNDADIIHEFLNRRKKRGGSGS
jgi:hypothetical protein